MPLPALMETLWNDLQSVRIQLLKEVEGLSQAQADWRTSDQDWSVGEIVHYLTLAEVGTGKVTSRHDGIHLEQLRGVKAAPGFPTA